MHTKPTCTATFLTLLLIGCLLLFGVAAQAADRYKAFTDVSADAWYAPAVDYCRTHALMNGTTNSTFAPESTLTQAMLVTLLYKQAGSPAVPSTENDTTNWFTQATLWATENQLFQELTEGPFLPAASVTRQQLALWVWRSQGSPMPAGTATAYADQSLLSPEGVQAVAWARENGLLQGKANNHFAPQELVSRAEAAVLLQHLHSIPNSSSAPDPLPTLQLQIGSEYFTITLTDSPASQALLAQLPLTITMQELNGNEKYHYLNQPLPAATTAVNQIRTGDLMLYGDDCLVLFYEDFPTSYRYTRLGRIDDPTNLATYLGQDSCQVQITAMQ